MKKGEFAHRPATRSSPLDRFGAQRDLRIAWVAVAAALAVGGVLAAWLPRPWRDSESTPTGRAWLFAPRLTDAWLPITRVPRALRIGTADVAPDGTLRLGLDSGHVLSSHDDGATWAGPLEPSVGRVLRVRTQPGVGLVAEADLPIAGGPMDLVRIGGRACYVKRRVVWCDGTSGSHQAFGPVDVADLAVAGDGTAVIVGESGAYRASREGGGWERIVIGAIQDGKPRRKIDPASEPPSRKKGAWRLRELLVPSAFAGGPLPQTQSAREAPPPSAGAVNPPASPPVKADADPSSAPPPHFSLHSVSISDNGRVAWAIGTGVVARLFPYPRTWTPEAFGIQGDPMAVKVTPSGARVFIAVKGSRLWEFDATTAEGARELATIPPRPVDDFWRYTIEIAADDRDVLLAGEPVSLTLARNGANLGSGPSDLLHQVTSLALRGDRIVAVLDRSLVLVSLDGGRSFRRALVRGREILRSGRAPEGGFAWATTSGGEIFHSVDDGSTWRATQLTTHPLLLVSRSGTEWTASDGSWTWSYDADGKRWSLKGFGFADLSVLPASLRGEEPPDLPAMSPEAAWNSGDDGVARKVAPAAAAAFRVGSPRQTPPPFSYLLFAASAACIAMAMRRPAPRVAEQPSVANLLVSDRPISAREQDVLDLEALAEGIGNFIRNVGTVPPLTIGVTGEWGTGKSSLLNLLGTRLRQLGHVPIVFNAWHNESEQDVLPSLFSTIIEGSRPNGVGWLEYRARLLFRRWSGRSAGLVLALAVAFVAIGYVSSHPDQVSSLFQGLGTLGKDDVLGQLSKLGGGVAGLVLIFRVYKDLRSYGVDVGKLAASFAGSASARDQRVQVSFRSRFARDFADVVWAHGHRRIVLFIDDLDRCSQENALRILKAVNFLTSAADCFVVLAMSRRIIERYVAAGFQELASDAGDEEASARAGPAAARVAPELRHARAYLEKLLNVEVAIPRPDARVEQRLFGAGEPAPARGGSLLGFAKVAWTAVMVGWLAYGAWWAGTKLRIDLSFLQHLAGKSDSTATGGTGHDPKQQAKGDPAAVPTTAQASTGPTGQPAPAPEKKPRPSDLETLWRAAPGDRLTEPAPPRRALGVPVTAALALALGGLLIVGRRQGAVVQDSPAFLAALSVWHPLIRRGNRTPRALKRLLNRLRFDAMRQRGRTRIPPGGWFVDALRAAQRWCGLGESEPMPQSDPRAIPEPLLVALAALADEAPDVLEPDAFRALWAGSGHTAEIEVALEEGKPGRVRDLVMKHVERFGPPSDPVELLERFRALRSGVAVR
jgi:hypothetical protein